MAHPLALQLRNLQSLVEIGVDKNTTVVFPAPLMTTIAELGSLLAGEPHAAGLPDAPSPTSVQAASTIASRAERRRAWRFGEASEVFTTDRNPYTALKLVK